jgi:DNA (cytosine-5)-methyltransferase 1
MVTRRLSDRTVVAEQRPTVVSVFSGGGGLDLGLEMAGFATLAAIELDKWACWTLRTNQEARHELPDGRIYLDGATVLERDVRDVSGQELLRIIGRQPGELSVLCGGPPCVSFSIAGARAGLASETGMLFEAYARMLRVLKPRAFVFENVRGLLTAAGPKGEPAGAWPVIVDRLGAAGYRIAWRVLDAARYGVPQHRERVIVVGLRGMRGAPFVFPEPTHGDTVSGFEPLVDVRTAFNGLPPAAAPGAAPSLASHVARAHSAEVQASFAATPPGKRNDRWKRDRLRWDQPAKVIRAQGKLKSDGKSRHPSSQSIHPEEHRQVTVRECARIQSFPDWYVFPPTHCNGFRVVGDAVPPLLAESVGRALQSQLAHLAALDIRVAA